MKLLRIVCFEFGVDVDDLFKFKISKQASIARKVAAYILYTDKTPTTIMHILGITHIQQVYSSRDWVIDQMVIDLIFKRKVERIKQVYIDADKIQEITP